MSTLQPKSESGESAREDVRQMTTRELVGEIAPCFQSYHPPCHKKRLGTWIIPSNQS